MKYLAVPNYLAVSLLAFSLAGTANAQNPLPPASEHVASTSAVAAPVQTSDEDPNTIRVLLSPELETTLVAQMVGRISDLKAQLGGKVQKGRPIVSFDCSEAQARLRMAQAEQAAAQEMLTVKQRLRKLDAAGDMEVSMAASEVHKAQAAISLARAQLNHCSVLAPFDGRVVKVHVKPFQGVNVGAPLVELVSEGPLRIRLNVPSRWLRELKVGTRFEVTINETGNTYPAEVNAINARVDAVAQTIELEARLVGNHPDLLAGMSGIARFWTP